MNYLNVEVFVVALVLGGIAKYVTLRRPTQARKAVTALVLILVAVVLGAITPPEITRHTEVVLLVLAVGDIAGELLGEAVDKYRVKRVARGYVNGNASKNKRAKN